MKKQHTSVYLLLIHFLYLLLWPTNGEIIAETPKEIFESKAIKKFFDIFL